MLAEFKTSVGEGMEATSNSSGLLANAADAIGNAFSGGGGSSSSGDNAAVVAAVKQLNNALTRKGIKISNIEDIAG